MSDKLPWFRIRGRGLHALDALPQGHGGARVALITGHPSVKSLLKDLHGPNIFYLVKPIDLPRLEALLADESRPTNQLLSNPWPFFLSSSSRMFTDFGPTP